MCVDWIALYLIELMLIVSVVELIELYAIVEMCWFGNEIDNVLLCELLFRSGELKVMMNELLPIDWFVVVVKWGDCGMCWNEKWDEKWDVELLMMKEWFELLIIAELDWIVKLCELHVFDGEGGQALEKDRGKQPETSNQ